MNPVDDQPIKVALLGCGVVGSQVARLLTEGADDLRARTGRPIQLVGIGVRTVRPRASIAPELFTTDIEGMLARDDLDLVIELMGGLEPAKAYITQAIRGGASVVTANKALLASHGQELFDAAQAAGVDLYYEAAVAGAIPIIRPLRESLVGDAVTSVMGIVNGTTNYILGQMHNTGATFEAALGQAQQLGYAEADPTADVEGYDAAAKAALLASLAFHTRVTLADVSVEGISSITPEDIAAARAMNCTIKLLAQCREAEGERVSVGVHPTLVSLDHPLASVQGANNAVYVSSRNAGELMFMGPGAGGNPTASAVMGDVVTAARNRVRGVRGPDESAYRQWGILPEGDVDSRFYTRFAVADAPGVLAAVAAIFATNHVSIQTIRQESLGQGDEAQAVLSIVTHRARQADLAATVAALEADEHVVGRVRVLRVEGE